LPSSNDTFLDFGVVVGVIVGVVVAVEEEEPAVVYFVASVYVCTKTNNKDVGVRIKTNSHTHYMQ